MNVYHLIIFVAGLSVTFTYDDLSEKKKAFQSHTHPHPENSFNAMNAVDRVIGTCTRTLEIGRTAYLKTVWWKVDLGAVYNIYKINIMFKNYDKYEDRQRGRFAGFSLFVSEKNFTTAADIQASILCYKDGLQLPPLNFTAICTERGRYVIFYNERLDGVDYPDVYETDLVFTELCEVVVQGCTTPSVYGRNCNIPCPINCKDNACDIQSGTCFGCTPGWTGMSCDSKCDEGWYGVKCVQKCAGHCRDNNTCNHETGRCDRGCDAGWTESSCDKECNEGTFGYDCTNNCSGHCLKNTPCNKQTGHCDSGCDPGYTNGDCSKECKSGYFGMGCNDVCSSHCLNNERCDHVSGMCPYGCQDGYEGTHCQNSCNDGYYGRNCSGVCSPNCKTCNITDGKCSCKAGWMGLTCAIACLQSYGENCRHPCSPNCYNQSCDRFNGRCHYCCTGGFHGEMCYERHIMPNQNESSSNSWIIGLIVSLFINCVLISGVCLLCRGIYTKKVSISRELVSCSKMSICYTDYDVKTGENSTYQELDLSREEIQYQNTTIR